MNNLIAWLAFGLITGVVANLIDPHPSRGGVLGTILLGIAGAVVGGFIGNMVFGVGVTGFDFPSFAVAVLGSLILLFLGRAFGRA